MSKAVMQQALEALDAYSWEQVDAAKDALRERLAQPQMQPCAGRNCGSTNPNLHSAECFEDYEKSTGMAQQNEFNPDWDEVEALRASLREHMAEIHRMRAVIEQAQEPVAWMYHGIRHDDTPHERPSLIWKPDQMDVMSFEKGAKATPLYTAPPQRQWHGLTDEEIATVKHLYDWTAGWTIDRFARAIESKLREKNT